MLGPSANGFDRSILLDGTIKNRSVLEHVEGTISLPTEAYCVEEELGRIFYDDGSLFMTARQRNRW